MKRLNLLLPCLAALTFASVAQAAALVSNLGNAPAPAYPNYWPVGSGSVSLLDDPATVYEEYAVPFFTNNASYQLDSVQVDLLTAAAGQLTVSLYGSLPMQSSLIPGSFIATLSGTTSPNGVTTYTPPAPIILAQATRYFIVVAANAGSTYKWVAQDAQFPFTWSGPGGMYANFIFYRTVTGNPMVNHQLNVTGTYIPRLQVNATPIPEPGTIVGPLTACGAVALTVRARRRNHSAD